MKKIILGLFILFFSFSAAKAQTVLAKGTSTSVASVTIDFSTYYNLYDVLEIMIYDISPVSNNVNLQMQVSADGTNFDNGASAYAWAYQFNGQTNSNADASIHLVNGQGNGAGTSLSGVFRAFSPNNTNFFPFFTGQLAVSLNGVVPPAPVNICGVRSIGQITKAVKFFYSSGNVANFSYKVLGYAN